MRRSGITGALATMLAILAEPAPAQSQDQVRRRGQRAINAGKFVTPARSQGQCIHRIRLDRRCDACGREVCRHGVGTYTSCPHCAAESDARLEPAWTRYRPDGQPFGVKRPEIYAMTSRQIVETAAAELVVDPIVQVFLDEADVTESALAADEEKGEVLIHQGNAMRADPVVRRGKVRVVRRSQIAVPKEMQL
jgi:hypothetical protein